MFFICELKKLRQLKESLLARFRCEKNLADLPNQIEPRIEACEELAALRLAEENLELQKKIDVQNRKKRIRRATWTAFFISLIVSAVVTVLLGFITILPTALIIAGATLVLTLIVHLIAKSCIKKGRAKNAAEIAACEEELACATEAFEAAKIRIEEEVQTEIALYKGVLAALEIVIKKNDLLHDCDKNYNTVCQIIWCFEHKYAYCIKDAKQWIARANHSKYVRTRLEELKLNPQDAADVDIDAADGNDCFDELPQTTEAEA